MLTMIAGAKGAKGKGATPADMVSRFPAEPEAEMLTMIGGRAGARLGGLDGAQAQGDNVDMMPKFRSDKPTEVAAAGAKAAKAKGAAPAGGEQIPLDMVSRFPAEPEAEM
eukprot:EG_transcript_32367